jgi:primosomal protein N' (replication factor Y) (superfamily II helicase)
LPDNPLLNLLIQQGYDAFAKALLLHRQQAALPPFHYLALIRAQAKDETKVLQFLHLVKEQLKEELVNVLGPAPAPLARKATFYHLQLLVKSSSRKCLHQALTKLKGWVTINKLTRVQWSIDIDPMDLS